MIEGGGGGKKNGRRGNKKGPKGMKGRVRKRENGGRGGAEPISLIKWRKLKLLFC